MTTTEPRTAPRGTSAPDPVAPLAVRRADRPRAGGWTLRRMFLVGASVAALLMIVMIATGAAALGRLTDARTALLDEIGPAYLAGQDLSVALLNQETAIRGFELTRRPEFLDPYRAGQAAEARDVETVRGYLVRHGGSTAGLDAVEAAVGAWRTGYADAVVAGVALTPDAAAGKQLFDGVRGPLRELTTSLNDERLDARTRLNAAADVLRWVGIAITAVMVAFLATAAWGLRRGVLDPVAALAGRVREVVSGDVHREVRGEGPRELVELGADVDAMRVHISNELDLLQQANQQLDDQARDLERSNRDLEQFAYVASHDLQEPLRKVSSFCQLLKRRYGGQLDERADQYIEFAVDGALRMQRLINDLLAFSRVGRTTSGFEPVDLHEIGLAAAAQVEIQRAEVDGRIVVGELPRVQGDAALLRQLLFNLIGNGLKFRRPDVDPVVRVEARPSDEGWEFAVADNGIGIEPEYAEKIFVIFQRLHGRDMYSGTGIGLALVKKIVEFHGGRVWLDTAPRDEPGTVIRFTLPVDRPQDTPQEQP